MMILCLKNQTYMTIHSACVCDNLMCNGNLGVISRRACRCYKKAYELDNSTEEIGAALVDTLVDLGEDVSEISKFLSCCDAD